MNQIQEEWAHAERELQACRQKIVAATQNLSALRETLAQVTKQVESASAYRDRANAEAAASEQKAQTAIAAAHRAADAIRGAARQQAKDFITAAREKLARAHEHLLEAEQAPPPAGS